MLTLLAALILAQPAPPPLDPALKARFDNAADYSAARAGRAVLIQQHGKIIYERYDNGGSAETPQPLASGTKSFTGVAAMFAVQDGLFTLDEKVADTITEWKSDPQKSQITVRHLLTLSSGLQPDGAGVKERNRDLGAGKRSLLDAALSGARQDWFKEAVDAPMTGTPGGQFAYGGNHYYAFGEFLERKLKASTTPQKTVWDYYTAKLFDPIGLHVARIGKDKAGHPNLPGGCSLTTHEWVKFGQFVLDKGAWPDAKGEKQQLLKPELLAQCFVPSQRNPMYGLTFWLGDSAREASNPFAPGADKDKEDTRTALRERITDRLKMNANTAGAMGTGKDGKPIQVHMAAGLGGQRLYIIPHEDMVIVRFAQIGNQAGRAYTDRAFLANLADNKPDRTPEPSR